ncbi:cell wall-active antibiotics response protein LiaF [Bacillus sp. Marseille-P3661]|uniref:cell wall-active antibiotics response protein LiaF n=1 Tax=Bacillus sp. Marseille-P3661 TaxID=1936234 RepID=UPI000C829214|nr:cell wall-active antibiotics response protein LiaF [Bacillus sp. Marseille-P3661]
MFHRLSTDKLNWILIIGVILLIVEVAFFNGGLVFTVVFSSFLSYIGWKKYQRIWGKVLFWIGIISLVITILNMIAVRFLFIAAIVLFVIHYSRSKKEPEKIIPQFEKDEDIKPQEPLIKIEPLLEQRLLGDQKTSDTVYKWHDVNIHGGFGDRIIDLSNTVLPEESIISIRHFIGNIKVYVPYEVEVYIIHSSLIGRASLLGEHYIKLMNQSISYQSEEYYSKKPRVKILTSIWSGDIEVKRI